MDLRGIRALSIVEKETALDLDYELSDPALSAGLAEQHLVLTAPDIEAILAAAIDRIERICEEEGIACDFRRVDGYLFTPS